jgi:ferredoxin
MVLKVFVDQELCISCGLCISICDEVFSWNEDDKAQAIDSDIPEEFVDEVNEAVESCPTDAIQYEEE